MSTLTPGTTVGITTGGRGGGSNKRGYRENFCHYVRVLVLWAPLKWFLYANVLTVIRPWTVSLVASLFFALGIAVYLWPDLALRTLFISLGGGLGLTVIVGFLAVVIRMLSGSERLRQLGHRLDGWDRAVGNWFSDHEVYIGVGIVLIPVSLFGTVLGIVAYEHPILFAIGVACFTGLVVVLGLLAVPGYFLYEYLEERLATRPRTTPKVMSFARGISEGVQITGQYIITKKRRVCPFIEFKIDTQENGLRTVS